MNLLEILKKRAILNRSKYQERIVDEPWTESSTITYLGWDASVGMGILQDSQGNIFYGNPVTNGVVGVGDAVRWRQGAIPRFDAMPGVVIQPSNPSTVTTPSQIVPTLLWQQLARQEYGLLQSNNIVPLDYYAPFSLSVGADGRSLNASQSFSTSGLINLGGEGQYPTYYSASYTFSRSYSSDDETYFQIVDSGNYTISSTPTYGGFLNTWGGTPISFTTPVTARVEVSFSMSDSFGGGVPFVAENESGYPQSTITANIISASGTNISPAPIIVSGLSSSTTFEVAAGATCTITLGGQGQKWTLDTAAVPNFSSSTEQFTASCSGSSSVNSTITVTASIIKTQFLLQQGSSCNTVLSVDNFGVGINAYENPGEGSAEELFAYSHASFTGLNYVLINKGFYLGAGSTTSTGTLQVENGYEAPTTNSQVVYSYNNGTLTTYNPPATIPPTGTIWDSWIRSYFSETSGLNSCASEYKESDYNFVAGTVYWLDRSQEIAVGGVTQTLLKWLQSDTTSNITAIANIQNYVVGPNSCTLSGNTTQKVRFNAANLPNATLLGVCLSPS